MRLLAPLFILPLCLTREVTFPPSSSYQSPIGAELFSDIDVSTGSAFNGLTTFANVPYVHCLSSDKDVEKYDIAFLGAPFDTVRKLLIGVSFLSKNYIALSVMSRAICFTLITVPRVGSHSSPRSSLWTGWDSSRLSQNKPRFGLVNIHWQETQFPLDVGRVSR